MTLRPLPSDASVDALKAEAVERLAREYGFGSWAELEYHLTMPPGRRQLHQMNALLRTVPGVRSGKLPLRDYLERQAVAFHQAHQAGVAAVGAIIRVHARGLLGPVKGLSDEEVDRRILATAITLDTAREIIAHLYSLPSWQAVLAHPEVMIDPLFEDACDAIPLGDARALRDLVAKHPYLIQARSPFHHHMTLLHYVAANGCEIIRQWQSPANAAEIARILLEAGADPNATTDLADSFGKMYPLTLLVTSGHPAGAGVQGELVEVLCRGGAKPDGLGDDGLPLWEAIKWEYTAAVDGLARSGARVDNLLFAAAVGDLAAVKASFEDQGGLKPGQSWGQARAVEKELGLGKLLEYSLIFAAAHGRAAVVEFLLTKSPDLTVKEPFWKTTAREAAEVKGHPDVVALFGP
jgi:hypothetical protein